MSEDPDKSKNELAADRTDLAEDRTVLANERTFAGWMRTGLAAVGIGVGFSALFRTLSPDFIPKAIATVFLVIAIIIFVAAERRACAVMNRLTSHEVKTVRAINLRLLTGLAVAATLGLIAAIWILRVSNGGGAPPG